MSQKAWMNAYTKGSKDMQARLARVHANNPEFQDFVKKHGFGGNLSVKQSGKQQKSAARATVAAKPVGGEDRLELIKRVALKLRDRHLAASNRAHFGGELGGDFSIGRSGFRRYSEGFSPGDKVVVTKTIGGGTGPFRHTPWFEKGEKLIVKKHHKNGDVSVLHSDGSRHGVKIHHTVLSLEESWDESGYKPGEQSLEWKEKVAKEKKDAAKREIWNKYKKTSFASGLRNAKRAKTDEDVSYKDASYTMRRGGWVVNRNGKVASIVLPTEDHAKRFIDSTRMTLGRKVGDVVRKKAKEIARGLGRHSLATESAANRRRIRSWDSAVLPVERDHPLTVVPKGNPPFTPDKPKKNLGIVVGKNDPGYSRARHLARLGLKRAMATEAQDPEVLKLRAAGKHVQAGELERKALSKGYAQEKRNRVNAAIEYIKNPKYSVLDKNTINSLLKGK